MFHVSMPTVHGITVEQAQAESSTRLTGSNSDISQNLRKHALSLLVPIRSLTIVVESLDSKHVITPDVLGHNRVVTCS